MRGIGAKRGPGATPSQVALAWCMAKGTTPIPGVRTVKQAEDNIQALKLKLDAREVLDLDAAAAACAEVLNPGINPMPKESVDTKRKFFEA